MQLIALQCLYVLRNLGHLVAQLGNPAKAERLMDFGGSFVHFGGMAFQVRGLRSAYLKLWDRAHVLILNTSLTYTDKGVHFKGLCTQLFTKWSFVLVYPTSLIRHKSKYSIIFPYLRCNVSEC